MTKPAKITFIQTILSDLLDAEKNRLTAVLESLLKSNHECGGSSKAFLYKGQVFNLLPIAQVRGEKILPVKPTLHDEVEYLISLRSELTHTEQKLRQGLSVVVNKCQSLQDLRDALPDILVREIPSLRGLQRTRPEGYLLEHNQRLKEQFEKVVDLALTFAAKRMLY